MMPHYEPVAKSDRHSKTKPLAANTPSPEVSALEQTTQSLIQHLEVQNLARRISEQHECLQAPEEFPQSFRFFPITRSLFLQKVVMRLFGLVLRHQRVFNGKITETFGTMLQIQQSTQKILFSTHQQITQLETENQKLRDQMGDLCQQLVSFEQYHRASVASLRSGLVHSQNHQPEQFLDTNESLFSEIQNKILGSREATRKRFEGIFELVSSAQPQAFTSPLIDLASQRGEWLQVLQDKKVVSSGFESNSQQVQLCRSFGLAVSQHPVPAKGLKTLPDQSQATVTGFGIAERLSLNHLVQTLNESFRVLKSGGTILFECLNPENISVAATEFWDDPQRIQLFPASVFKLLLEQAGFTSIEVVESSPDPDQLIGGIYAESFNEKFHCPKGYLVLGRKK